MIHIGDRFAYWLQLQQDEFFYRQQFVGAVRHFAILCAFSICLLAIGSLAGWGARGWWDHHHATTGSSLVLPDTHTEGSP